MDRSNSFVSKATFTISLSALAVVALYLLHHLGQMLLVVFGGILFGILLDGLISSIESKVTLPRYLTLPSLLVIATVILAVIGFLAGPSIADQFEKLGQRIPEAFSQIEAFLQERGWGRELLGTLSQPDNVLPSSTAILGKVSGVFSSAAGAFTAALIVFFVGVYLALSPGLYRENALRLVTRKKRERAGDLLNAVGNAMRWWLVGRFSSMLVVGLLTAIALWIVGVPLAFSLGLIAALLSFVPFIGPIVAVIPALLVALAEEPAMAVWVLLIYLGVQFLESYFITPFIEQRAVSVPPALLITGQVLMGVLFGVVGVFLAIPILVVVVVAIQLLYVEDVLGEETEVMGAH